MSDYSLLATLGGNSSNSLFGNSVSVSIDYAVVGVRGKDVTFPLPPPYYTNYGEVNVYKSSSNGTTWTLNNTLQSPSKASGAEFGNSVSISESLIAVGEHNASVGGKNGSGLVHIYKLSSNATTWTLTKTFSDADKSSGGGIDYNFGESVSISGNYLIVGEPGDHGGSDKGSVTIYKTTDNGTTWSNSMHHNGASHDNLGTSVYITGQYAIACGLGDSANSNYGVAYIFYQNSGGSDAWGVSQTITSGLLIDTGFGVSVSLYGDYAVIGEETGNSGTGQAIVYYKDQEVTDNWGVVKTLTASDGSSGDYFGNSVSIIDNTIIVGAYGDDGTNTNEGSAYVYTTTDNWSTYTENKISTTNSETDGYTSLNAVAVSPNYILVGHQNQGNDVGKVYIHKMPTQYYTVVDKLWPSDNTGGSFYGTSCAVWNNIVVVSSPLDNSNKGSVSVYTYSNGDYTLTKTLTASDPLEYDYFGSSVSIDINTIVVGAFLDDTGAVNNHGSVYVYTTTDNWSTVSEQKLSPSSLVDDYYFGLSVSVSGNYIAVGAQNAPNAGTATGEVQVFEKNPSTGTWAHHQTLTSSDATFDDHFGEGLSIHGDYIVVGTTGDDTEATGDHGSVYIFYKPTDYWIQLQKITASSITADTYFGRKVKIYGHTIAVAEMANRYDNSTNLGKIHIFTSSDGLSWTSLKTITGTTGEYFAFDMDLYENNLLVSAWGSTVAEIFTGLAYIYKKDQGGTDNWGLKKKIINYGSVLNDYNGYTVALSGNIGVMSSLYDDDKGTDSGASFVINVEEETVSDPNLSSSHVIFVQSVGTNNTYLDFSSYDGTTIKLVFTVGSTHYYEDIVSLNYTVKNDFFNAVVDAMNTAYGSTNFSFDTDNNKITSSVAYTFNFSTMNADLSNTIFGSTSDKTPVSYDLSINTSFTSYDATTKNEVIFTVDSTQYSEDIVSLTYTVKNDFFNAVVDAMNTAYGSTNFSFDTDNNEITSNVAYTFNFSTMDSDLSNTIVSSTDDITPDISYDLSINTSFTSYDATKNKVIFTVGSTQYSDDILSSLTYTLKNDFFNAVVDAMNTAYGSTNFSFDTDNNKITSSVAYTFNFSTMNSDLSNTIVGSTSDITPVDPYDLSMKDYTELKTQYETNKGSFLSYYNDLTKFRIGEGLLASGGSFFSYSLNTNWYNRTLNRVNTIRINIKVPTYSASSNIRTDGSVTYFTLNSTASSDGWTMTTYYADNENGVGSIDIVLVAPSNAWSPVSVSRDTYNLIDFDITATNAQKLEHLFKDSFWETDSNGDVSGLSVIVSLKDSSYLTEDVIFKYPYDAVNIYTYREPCKTSEIPDTGILSNNSKVSKDGTVLYTGHYEDGDFPTPLVCYSDAIVYGIGAGSYPSGFDGDGVFLVAQFDEYPYDPFATLLPDTTWLQMFVKQSSKDTSKWIVSFHARMDVVYNISSASGSNYYKIADFVPSTGITMNGVLSSISNIRWGFYGTDRTTAYYYSPIYGTYNYINDQSSVSSSGITILSSPSKSSNVVSQTQHQNVCSFGTRLASNFSFNRTYEYGSPVSMYTTDGGSNRLSIYNPLRYNGLRTSTRMFPFTNDQDSDYNIDISLQYIKKIEIKSADFNVGTEYFRNIRSGWTYSQSSDLGIVTITFEYTDNGYGYDASGFYLDNTQLAIVNVSGSDLTTFIGLLSAPLNDSGNKVTYNVYYTNNDLNSNADAVNVTIGSETYKTVSDDLHNNYYYSQEGYDGVFQLRLKESYPSSESLNSNLNLILTERGSVKEVRKSSDTSTKTSVYTISNPTTESDPPTVIDATERFGKHIHMFIRESGEIYVRNGLRYYDNSTSVFDYKPYDTEYNAPTWTGLKSFSMASTLFDSSITYFTDIQTGWNYTQTGTSPNTVTIKFEYTGDVNGIDLSAITGNGEYVGKPNINVDIVSGIMRTVYSALGPNIVYTYEYFGSDGSITQTGYDGVFGVSVELGAVSDSQDTLLAYDTEKNLIDEQGSIITASAADPHVMPITGEPYDLPHEDRTFLLYYNNNSEYPISIKGKCWHLPESKYKRNIQRLHEIGYHERAEKYLNLFENNTYFRYIEFVCGHEQLIVDMESLWYCSMTTVEDVDNFTLPHLPSYQNNSFISITDFAHSKTGIISVRPPNKTTLERTVTMNGPDTIIQLKLMIDSRDITNRNGIIIRVRGPIDEHIGSLVRKSIIYSDFSEKLNVLVVPNHLLTKKLFNNNVYTASSYGATKEEYEYDQLDIFTSCANNVPNKDKTYLLYSNNDINYPITIKTKCWYIPEEKYINKLNKMRNVGYIERAQKYEKIFKKHTFMRYVEFVCCEETLIIDMESLWYYSALSMEEVNNFDLIRLEGYKNNKHISITDFEHSKTGLNVKRSPNKTTVQRIVTLRGKNIFIEARLMLDSRNITERNNMEVKIMGLKDHHNGLLVDNEIIETHFSFSKLSIEMEDTQGIMPISEILKINV